MSSIDAPDHESSIEAEAPPEVVWGLVSDVTRTSEWSPVVTRCEWAGDAPGPQLGARFRGYNRFNGLRWSRECEVTEAEPGTTFAFSTFGRGQEQTRWRYRLEPTEAGTRITLGYQIVSMPRWVRLLRRLPGGQRTNERQARWNIEESLRRLAAACAAEPVAGR